ncbi:MAP4 protein, partial [Thinocorus orbignyianus]|nr:MAP4 protein [Thinocorus orbignyianus]
SPSLYHSKLEQIPEISSQDKEKEEAAAKGEKRNATDGAATFPAPQSKGTEVERGKPAPPERKEVEVSNVQSSLAPQQGDFPRDGKAEEAKPAEGVTGNDITAPPNKELPPSPEKKTKPAASAPSTKPAATKARPLSAPSPKRPLSALAGPNKKPTSPTAGPTATAAKRPATGTARPSSLAPKETKPKVADGKAVEKKTSPTKPPSSAASRPAAKSSPAPPRTTAAAPVTAAA